MLPLGFFYEEHGIRVSIVHTNACMSACYRVQKKKKPRTWAFDLDLKWISAKKGSFYKFLASGKCKIGSFLFQSHQQCVAITVHNLHFGVRRLEFFHVDISLICLEENTSFQIPSTSGAHTVRLGCLTALRMLQHC